MLYSYCEVVRQYNLGSKLKIHAPGSVFQRLYVFLAVCKNGFKEACRPFIGIDRCDLKGMYPSHLLTVVGTNANDNIFLIAYAAVNSECKEIWWCF